MPEFIIRDSIENENLTVVSKDRYAANLALFRYLTNSGFRICVLKRFVRCKGRGFMHDHFIVVGDQDHCAPWLQEARQKAEKKEQEITFEHVDSLDAEAVSEWAKDIFPKEIWVYYVSHKYYDEFSRSGPTIRSYSIGLRAFASAGPGQEDDPVIKALQEAKYISADTKREKEL